MSGKERKNRQSASACDGQTNIFEMFIDILDSYETELSAEQLFEASQKLEHASKQAKQRAEEERRQKAEQEKQEVERLQREAQERHVAEVTSMELPMDWDNLFLSDSRTEGVHADSPADGLILSLCNLGRVDIEYISAVCGQDYKAVIEALRGSIYQNPDTWDECFYKGWETADEYLSGNMIRKLKTARSANIKYSGYFEENIAAIRKVLPTALSSEEIYVTLGSPWVPADIIDEFIYYLLDGSKNDYSTPPEDMRVRHDVLTGTWEIPAKWRYEGVKAHHTYGTKKCTALKLMEDALNMKPVAVYETRPDRVNGGTQRIYSEKETLLALDRQRKIIQEFQKWVWKDSFRRQRLEEIYNLRYGSVCQRQFDGSFLTFPGMADDVSLYPYQKDAVARILFSPNTLLAHEVGAGKTYIMIAAGMEMRRMGLSRKNMYVVPKNIQRQWRELFLRLYPQADVLCVEPSHFTPDRREETLRRIRDEDLDAVIISYSSFEMIPLSRKYQKKELMEQQERIAASLRSTTRSSARLRRRSEAVEAALQTLELALDDLYDRIHFDELGIGALFVDEAHNFKNIKVSTRLGGIPGISAAGSKRCEDMLSKVHCVQKANNGGGVVMATGTPISNSITDIFAMQQFLQSGELALVDLQSFDSWVGMFAEKTTEFEIDVDTSSYRMRTRLARFHNLPELTAMLASVADFHDARQPEDMPDFDGYDDVTVGRSEALEKYLRKISARADSVRAGNVSRTADNMLLITVDGRKAALDMRLVEPDASCGRQSKVVRCADRVADLYFFSGQAQSAQLIFCDTSTPKSGFNIYDEMRQLLVERGIPKEQIAFVHDHDSPTQRETLFARVRRGEIRVLLGSTFKLGLGVNIQDRLVALHHLDVPWRPSDMVQREGRILRAGNTSERIFIFRYITEGSFDAYSWQLLESKQRFISQLLSGTLSQRSGSDVDDTTLNYAEVKALAIGNPLIKLRVEVANELSKTLTLQQKLNEERQIMSRELAQLPGSIEIQQETVQYCREDTEYLEACRRDYTEDERRIIRTQLQEGLKDNERKSTETVLLTYQGFNVILPSNMLSDRPFVWLERSGRYYVRMGDSGTGMLIRIDNFLSGLGEHLAHLEEELHDMIRRQNDLTRDLEQRHDYLDEISELRNRLADIDNRLGI